MKCLNKHIARKANAKGRYTGHFWEAWFHSQALKTESALISAMAYVDLNPIRAKMANTLVSCEYTNIRLRVTGKPTQPSLIESVRSMVANGELQHSDLRIEELMVFADEVKSLTDPCIPMNTLGYLALVDVAGRIARYGKRGVVPHHIALILQRLGLSRDDWLKGSTSFLASRHNRTLRKNNG